MVGSKELFANSLSTALFCLALALLLVGGMIMVIKLTADATDTKDDYRSVLNKLSRDIAAAEERRANDITARASMLRNLYWFTAIVSGAFIARAAYGATTASERRHSASRKGDDSALPMLGRWLFGYQPAVYNFWDDMIERLLPIALVPLLLWGAHHSIIAHYANLLITHEQNIMLLRGERANKLNELKSRLSFTEMSELIAEHDPGQLAWRDSSPAAIAAGRSSAGSASVASFDSDSDSDDDRRSNGPLALPPSATSTRASRAADAAAVAALRATPNRSGAASKEPIVIDDDDADDDMYGRSGSFSTSTAASSAAPFPPSHVPLVPHPPSIPWTGSNASSDFDPFTAPASPAPLPFALVCGQCAMHNGYAASANVRFRCHGCSYLNHESGGGSSSNLLSLSSEAEPNRSSSYEPIDHHTPTSRQPAGLSSHSSSAAASTPAYGSLVSGAPPPYSSPPTVTTPTAAAPRVFSPAGTSTPFSPLRGRNNMDRRPQRSHQQPPQPSAAQKPADSSSAAAMAVETTAPASATAASPPPSSVVHHSLLKDFLHDHSPPTVLPRAPSTVDAKHGGSSTAGAGAERHGHGTPGAAAASGATSRPAVRVHKRKTVETTPAPAAAPAAATKSTTSDSKSTSAAAGAARPSVTDSIDITAEEYAQIYGDRDPADDRAPPNKKVKHQSTTPTATTTAPAKPAAAASASAAALSDSVAIDAALEHLLYDP